MFLIYHYYYYFCYIIIVAIRIIITTIISVIMIIIIAIMTIDHITISIGINVIMIRNYDALHGISIVIIIIYDDGHHDDTGEKRYVRYMRVQNQPMKHIVYLGQNMHEDAMKLWL